MYATTIQMRNIIRGVAKQVNATIYAMYTDKANRIGSGNERYVSAWVAPKEVDAVAMGVSKTLKKKGFSNPVRAGNGYVRTNAVLG